MSGGISTVRYTDAQKAAVREACCDHGFTVKQAVAAALNGELPGRGRGLAPFSMTESMAGKLQWAEKRERRHAEQSAADPGQVVRQALGNMTVALDEQTRRMSDQKHKKHVTPAEVREWARAAQEVMKLARDLHGEVKPKPASDAQQNGNSNGAAASDDFIGGLAVHDRGR
jgi:hypothetical protein